MGGFGSGAQRSTHEGNVDDALALDIRVLRRLGVARPGECVIDTICWSIDAHERPTARLRIDLSAIERCTMTITANMPDEDVSQSIEIDAVPSGFGGVRHYFLCPVSRRRCEVLYYGDGRFASRQVQRLSFASQNMTDLSRARCRTAQLRHRLGGGGGPRPRGAKRSHLVERLESAQIRARELYRACLRKHVDRSGSRRIPSAKC